MPRISLRAYEKQIEDLIEQNRLQEAIDNCRQILMSYPKCISTYRILGKTLLEGKQYNEAADIFKRVLAVFPDDFISHVGMSIIYESENNLDASIWHMELAFDSQPSNITIQEELKRLFGRRDGTHPAKIRLTRGALVRMYARGELYPQAVAEIKSALVEDAKRLDLKVMLAKMYFLLGDSSEALNLSNELITDLPYCYEINKILVAILPTTNRSEKTPVYQDRIKALNPYEAFVNDVYLTEADVPDDQVLLNQLDEIQSAPAQTTPDWVQTIESKWEEPTNLDALEWLPQPGDAPAPKTTSPETFTPDTAPAEVPPAVQEPAQSADAAPETGDDQLPDWMRSAGWLPSEEQGTASSTESAPESQMAEQSGDLPDWLRSLAPEEAESQEDQPETVDQPSSTAAFTSSSQPEETEPAAENNSANDLPDWLKNFDVEGSGESEPKDDLPEWMQNLQSLEQTAEPAKEDQTPEANQEAASEPNDSPVQPVPFANIDEDMIHAVQTTRSLDPESAGLMPAEETRQPASAALPDNWKSNLVEEAPAADEVNDHSDSGLPDWVRSVMDKMPAVPEDLSTEPAQTHQEIPLNSESPAESTDEVQGDSENSTAALTEKSGDDLLSWLRDLKPTEDPALQEDSETTGSTGDLPVFEDNSPLVRLQHLTENEEQQQPADLSLNIPAPAPDENAEDNGSFESAVLPVEPVESTQPSSLLEHLSQIEAGENTPAAADAPQSPLPVEATSSLSAQLDQISEQIATGTSVDTVIRHLTDLSSQNTDNYQIWQLLGDAYAKIDAFSNALHAYNKAEELILKHQ